tara:strand:- start:192 stop:596 length:405 start_codon:yes stop_codon:yes gene_type:complete
VIDIQFVDTKMFSIENYSKWVKKIIRKEKKIVGDIVFVFCNDKYMLEKNIKFLNHDTLTDVITFDYCKGEIISGDIIISIDRVKENATIFNVSFSNELERVMAHGLLHLLGYKDKNKKDALIMREKENFYISNK